MSRAQETTTAVSQRKQHYLVLVQGEQSLSEDVVQCITPHVMQWNDRVWIMDLTSCLNYWQKQAQGCDWQELVRQVIEVCVGKDYIATLSHHPWPALLLAEDMQRKGLSGFVDLSQRFTQNLYQQVSWDSWLQVARQIGEHFKAIKIRRFREQSLRTNLDHLQKTIERLGFLQVSDLKGTDAYSIKRRFGPVIKSLWQWGEYAGGERQGEIFFDFPWRSYQFYSNPSVQRHLEHAIYEWEHVSTRLRDDLNRLCALPQWSAQDKVLCLEWEVVFHDLKVLLVPVIFRHPHSLHQDSPDQKTALLQAYYRFQQALQEYTAQLDAIDEFGKPLIISWTITLKESLRMPAQVRDIFGDRSGDEQTLAGLENRLSVALHAYELSADHQPEDLFHTKFHKSVKLTEHERKYFLYLARIRPLFIYRRPRKLERSHSRLWRFLERTMNKWWQEHINESYLYRDYYQMTDERGRNLWVYKDSVGKWFIHGIFA